MRGLLLLAALVGAASAAPPALNCSSELAIDTGPCWLTCDNSTAVDGLLTNSSYVHWDDSQYELQLCSFALGAVTVANSTAVSLEGDAMLELRSNSTIALDAPLRLDGRAGDHAAPLLGALSPGPGSPAVTTGDCAGVADAGFGSAPQYGARTLAPLVGGSAGCGDGPAGGAVRLEAAEAIWLGPSGAVTALGAQGDESSAGSGGAVHLRAPSIAFDAASPGVDTGASGRAVLEFSALLQTDEQTQVAGGTVLLANMSRTSCADLPTTTPSGPYGVNVSGALTEVYCEMTLDGGGWTLWYANSAAGSVTTADSWGGWLARADPAIAFQDLAHDDAALAGMMLPLPLPLEENRGGSVMARNIGDWGSAEYSIVSFSTRQLLLQFLEHSVVETDGTCHRLPDGEVIVFRNSDGHDATVSSLRSPSGRGFGWSGCDTAISGGDSEFDEPTYFFADVTSSAAGSRVRGVGGDNGGSASAVARYYVRPHAGPPAATVDSLDFRDLAPDDAANLEGFVNFTVAGEDDATHVVLLWATAPGVRCEDCPVVADVALPASSVFVEEEVPAGAPYLLALTRNGFAEVPDAQAASLRVGPPDAAPAPTRVAFTGGSLTVQAERPAGIDELDVDFVEIEFQATGEVRSYAPGAAANQTTDVWYGLTFDTAYAFRARWSTSVGGFGEWGASASLSTASDLSAPSAPSAPALVARTGGSVSLEWDAPLDTGGGDLTGYYVYVADDVVAGGVGLTDTAATVTSVASVPLAASTDYSVSVQAINAVSSCLDSDDVPRSDAVVVTTDAASAPSAVLNVAFTDTVGGSVTMVWDAPEDQGGVPIDAYDIIVDNLGLAYTDGDTTELTLYGVSHSVVYDVQVRAVNAAGNGSLSSVASFSTTADVPGVSDAPTLAAATGGSLSVQWDAPLDDGGTPIVDFALYDFSSGVKQYEGPSRNVTLAGLAAATNYTYVVRSSNAEGTSKASPAAILSTTAATVPSQPAVATTVTGGALYASWTAPEDTGGVPIDAYVASVSGAALAECLNDGDDSYVDVACSGSATECEFYGLDANTGYSVAVYAVNSAGNGDVAVVEFCTDDLSAPGLVTELVTVNATGGSVTFAWDDPLDHGGSPVEAYDVRYPRSGGSFETATVTQQVFAVFGLDADTSYDFYVAAANSDVLGSQQLLEQSTTVATEPTLPFAVAQVAATTESIDVEWAPPVDAGGADITQYNLVATPLTLPANQTVYANSSLSAAGSITGLEPGKQYYVSLRAVNGLGLKSDWTAAQTFKTNSKVPGEFGWAALDYYRSEADEFAQLEIAREGGSEGSVTLSVTSSSAGAVPDQDIVVFDAGAQKAYINVTWLDDIVYEASESFNVTLNITAQDDEQRRAAVTPASATTTVHLADDGDAGTLDFKSTAVSVPEDAGSVTLTVTRTVGTSAAVSAYVVTTAPDSPERAVAVADTLNFADGQSEATFSVSITDNSQYDYVDEVMTIALTALDGAVQGDDDVVELTITDDGDLSPPAATLAPTCSEETGGAILVSWLMPNDTGGEPVTSYILVRDDSVEYTIDVADGEAYLDTGLTYSASYDYKIKVVNTQGTGLASDETRCTTTDAATLPTAPATLATTAVTGGAIAFAWDAPVDSGGVSLIAYVLEINQTTTTVLADVVTPTTLDGYVAGLTAETNYQISVWAQNAVGLGPAAELVLDTSAPTQPDPPSIDEATLRVDSGYVEIDVVPPADTGGLDILTYLLYTDDGATLIYCDASSSVTVYGLSAETSYTYSAAVSNYDDVACEALATSDLSASVTVTTEPAAAPGVSSAPVLVEVTGGAATLSWDPPDDTGGTPITGFMVLQALKDDDYNMQRPIYEGADQTVTADGLTAQTEYVFAVAALNAQTACFENDELLWSDDLAVTTDVVTVPGQPTGLALESRTGGSITLSWSPPGDTGGADLLGFVVYRDAALLATLEVDAADESATDFGLAAETTYSYEVTAVSSAGEGARSEALEVATTDPTTPGSPDAPLRVSATGGSITVGWAAPLDTGGLPIVGYQLYLTQDAESSVVYDGSSDASTEAVLYGLAATTEYTYSILAINSFPYSGAFSDYATLRTDNATLPSAPLDGGSAATGGAVTVFWDTPLDTGGIAVDWYLVTRVDTAETANLTGSTRELATYGLAPETEYEFDVAAVNAVGEGPAVRVAVTTGALSKPSEVQNVAVVNVTGGAAVLLWDPPLDYGGDALSGYRVSSASVASLYAGEANVALIGGLTAEQLYTFQVSAVNSVGVSPSADIAVTTAAVGRPGPPTGLQGSSGSFDVYLAWTPPVDSGGSLVDHYVVEAQGDGANSSYNAVGGAAEFDVPALISNTQYQFRVRAVNVDDIESTTTPWISVSTDLARNGNFSFSAAAVTVREDVGTAVLAVDRSYGTFESVDVAVAVTGTFGGGVDGVDFAVANPVLYFRQGQLRDYLYLEVTNDTVYNDGKGVSLELTPSRGYRGANFSIDVTVADDNDGGIFAFRDAAYAELEDAGAAAIAVERTEGFDTEVTVVVGAHSVVTEARNSSFVPADQALVFETGVALLYASVALVDDDLYEQPDEVVALTLEVASGHGVLGPLAAAELTVLDDGDTSVPGQPDPPSLLATTGGSIVMALAEPDDTGGAVVPISNFTVQMATAAVGNDWQPVYGGYLGEFTQYDGLTAATDYVFRVAAVNFLGAGPYSDEVGMSTSAASVPTAPGAPYAVTVTGGAITVNWDPPLDKGGVPMSGYTVSSSALEEDAEVTDTEIALYGLTEQTAYSVTVQARNSVGRSVAWSDEVDVTTSEATLPAQPASPVAHSNTGGALTVYVGPPDDRGGVPVEAYSVTVDGEPFAAEFATSVDYDIKVTVTGLLRETSYALAVAARNSVGLGPYSAEISMSTSVMTSPAPPTDVAVANVTGGALTLTWVAPEDTGGEALTSYQVFRGVSFIDTSTVVYETPDADPPLSFTDFGRDANTTYMYQVVAINPASLCADIEDLQLSAVFYATTSAATAPGQPGAPSVVSLTGGSIVLEWGYPDDDGGVDILAFRLLIFDDDAGDWATTMPDELAYTFTQNHLTAETTYRFAVVAVNEVGDSPVSAAIDVTTLASTVPGAPVDVECSALGGGAVELLWGAPPDDGGTAIFGYVVTLYTSETADFAAEQLSLDSPDTSHIEYGLTAETTFTWSVAASNTGTQGEGAESEVFSCTTTAITTPSKPSGVSSQDALEGYPTGGAVLVQWTEPVDQGGDWPLTYTVFLFGLGDDLGTIVAQYDAGTELQLVVTGLTNGESYKFKVAGNNAAGEGKRSNKFWLDTAPDVTAPSEPRDMAVSAVSGGALNVTWTVPADAGGTPLTDCNATAVCTFCSATHTSAACACAQGWCAVYRLDAFVSYDVTLVPANAELLGAEAFVADTRTGLPSVPSAMPAPALALATSRNLTVDCGFPADFGGGALERVELSVYQGAEAIANFTTLTSGVGASAAVRASGLLVDSLYDLRVRAVNVYGLVGAWSAAAQERTLDSSEGVISFAQASIVTTEQNEVIVVTVTRTRGNSKDVPVIVSTHDMTARAAAGDYDAVEERTVTLLDQRSTATFELVLHDDVEYEAFEQFNVSMRLSNSTTSGDDDDEALELALLGNNTAAVLANESTTLVVTVEDDGDAGVLSFAQAELVTLENATAVGLTVTRTGGNSSALLASLCEGATCYTAGFADRATRAVVSYPISDNDYYDHYQIDHELLLSVPNTSAAAVDADAARMVVTVLDDGDISPPAQAYAATEDYVTGGAIVLTLDPSEDTGGVPLLYFVVEVRANSSSDEDWTATTTADDDLTFVQGFLDRNTAYEFRVTAANRVGLAEASPSFVVATSAQTSAPSEPRNLRFVSATGGRIVVEWDVPLDSGGILDDLEYTARLLLAASGDVVREVAGLAEQQATFSALDSETEYLVEVAATNGFTLHYESVLLYCEQLAVSTTAVTLPEAPAAPAQGVTTGGAIELLWEDFAADDGLDTGGAPLSLVNIYRRDDVQEDEDEVAPELVATTVVGDLSAQLGNMVRESAYEFFLQLENEGGVQALGNCTVLAGHTAMACLDNVTALALPGAVVAVAGDGAAYEVLAAAGTHEVSLRWPVARDVLSERVYVGGMLGAGLVAATGAATLPAAAPAPALTSRTGGAITVALTAPEDTGGLDIEGFSVLIDGVEVASDVEEAEYTEYSLVAGTEYAFQVAALNQISRCESSSTYAYSEAAVFSTTNVTQPTAPEDVRGADITGGQMTVRWSRPVDVGGEPVTMYTVVVGLVTEVNVTGETFSWTQGALVADTEYALYVYAHNSAARSEPGEGAAVTAAPSTPSEPRSVAAVEVTSDAVSLEWRLPFDTGGANITAYDVQETAQGEGTARVLDGATAYAWGELLASTEYTYRVRAINAAGLSGQWSAGLSNTTGLPDLPGKADPPVVQRVTGGLVELFLALPESMGGAPSGGYVLYLNGDEFASVRAEDDFLPIDAATWTVLVGDLNALTAYDFSLVALNEVGAGEVSDVVSVTTDAETVPGEPAALALGASTGGALLVQWDPPVDKGGLSITQYYAELTSGSLEELDSVVVQSATVATGGIYFTKLSPNANYEVHVVAYNDMGAGDAATLVTATLDVTAASAPQSARVLARTADSVSFAWGEPADVGGACIGAYRVGYAEWASADALPPAESFSYGCADSAVLNYTVGGLSPGAQHVFVVNAFSDRECAASLIEACTAGLTGAASAALVGRTAADDGAPDAPRVECRNESAVALYWLAPADTDDEEEADLVRYELRGDGALLYSGLAREFVHSGRAGLGATTYAVRAVYGDGSEAESAGVSVAPTAAGANQTECSAPSAALRTGEYAAEAAVHWVIDPDVPFAGLLLEVSVFDVECDHDLVVVSTPATGATVWSGGCARGAFDLWVNTSDTVDVALYSDGSWQGAGVELTYTANANEPVLASVACPATPSLCSGHGTCASAEGRCSCNIGYTGEDCSTPVFCPELGVTGYDPDPLCASGGLDSVVAVALSGSDARGTGALGPATESSPAAKPVASLHRAFELVAAGGTVLLFAGDYAPATACDAVLQDAVNVTVRSSNGRALTTIDCAGLLPGLTVANSTGAALEGVTVANTVAGAALLVRASTLAVAEVNLKLGQAGGLRATEGSFVALSSSRVWGNAAAEGAGVALADGSGLSMVDVVVEDNSATAGDGGGVLMRGGGGVLTCDGCEVRGNAAAAGRGGGLAVASSATVSGLVVSGNSAAEGGGGVAVVDVAGAVALSDVVVADNSAAGAGGGLLLDVAGADVSLLGSRLVRNSADGQGGAVAVRADASLAAPSSVAEANVAGEGGGGVAVAGGNLALSGLELHGNEARAGAGAGGALLATDAAWLTVDDVRAWNNTAQRGGGLALERVALATLSALELDGNVALGGGGGGGLWLNATAAELSAVAVERNVAAGGAGGGVLLCNASATGVSVEGNWAALWGGGVGVEGASALADSLVARNSAPDGGGVGVAAGASLACAACDVAGNWAARGGGGAYVAANGSLAGPALAVTDNVAGARGGGVHCDACAFVGGAVEARNNSAAVGGGLACDGGAGLRLADVALEGNAALWDGGGLVLNASTGVALSGVDVEGNVAAESGGGALLVDGAEVASWSGSVARNNASARGGGLFAAFSTLVAGGSLSVSGNAAGAGGGNVLLDAATLDGASVTGGAAPVGGGVLVGASGESWLVGSAVEGNWAARGGGVALSGASASVALSAVSVRGNGADGDGGGLLLSAGATATHADGVSVSGNSAARGAGVFVEGAEGSSLSLSGSEGALVEGNALWAPDTGGGANVFVDDGSGLLLSGCNVSFASAAAGAALLVGEGAWARLEGVTLRGCASTSTTLATLWGGGAVFVSASSALTLVDSGVVDNWAAGDGGGVALSSGASLTLERSELSRNRAGGSGGALAVAAGAAAELWALTADGNSAAYGGAVSVDGGALRLGGGSNLTGNAAAQYGGTVIGTTGASLDLAESTLSAGSLRARPYLDAENGMIADVLAPSAVYGGLLYVATSELWVRNCSLQNASAAIGGGVYVSGTLLRMSDSRVWMTHAFKFGGGVFVATDVSAYLTRVVLEQVSAFWDGGGLFVQTTSFADVRESEVREAICVDLGAGVFLDTEARLTLNASLVADNDCGGHGCGVYLHRSSFMFAADSVLEGNGALWADVVEGGGLYAVDSSLWLSNCSLVRNAALNGGGMLLDRSATAEVHASVFADNSALEEGGSVMARSFSALALRASELTASAAARGGCLAVANSAAATLEGTLVAAGAAELGGGVYVTDAARLALGSGCEVRGNAAETGAGVWMGSSDELLPTLSLADSALRRNGAEAKGGALYVGRPEGAAVERCAFGGNDAVVGSAVYWEFDALELRAELNLSTCEFGASNSGFAVSTNPVFLRLDDYPRGGIAGGLPTDEPPVVSVVDLYWQTALLDNATTCALTSSNYLVTPEPSSDEAVSGVVVVDGFTIKSEQVGTVANITVACLLPSTAEQAVTFEVVQGECAGGYELENNVCQMCKAGLYSPYGRACYECPEGGSCPAPSTSPETEQGYFLAEARESQYREQCRKDGDDVAPCASFFSYGDAWVYNCWVRHVGFAFDWTPEHVFRCLQRAEFYECEPAEACVAGVTDVYGVVNASSVCKEGYTGIKCGVCAEGYSRVQGRCESCGIYTELSAEARRMQIIYYGLLWALTGVLTLISIFVYLDISGERGLMQEARDVIWAHGVAMGKAWARPETPWRDRAVEWASARAEAAWARAPALVPKRWRRQPEPYEAHLFDVDVGTPGIGLRPEKFKIMLGFVQIYSNFSEPYGVPWSDDTQASMDFYEMFNLNAFNLARVGCVVNPPYYQIVWGMMLFVGICALLLCLIAAWGRFRYARLLESVPRSCVRCGLPVREVSSPVSFKASAADRTGSKRFSRRKAMMTNPLVGPGRAAAAAKAMVAGAGGPQQQRAGRSPEEARIEAKIRAVVTNSGLPRGYKPCHTCCPARAAEAVNLSQRQLIEDNLLVWKIRMRLRLNFRTYDARIWKLIFWFLLLSYAPVSATILRVFSCDEVGTRWYLREDYNIECYTSEWNEAASIASLCVLGFIVGTPLFFFAILWRARNSTVEDRMQLLRLPMSAGIRRRWLAMAREERESKGKIWVEPTEKNKWKLLRQTIRRRNMLTGHTLARLGFIYEEYKPRFWWYEICELVRKVFLNGFIVFLSPGSVTQILCGMGVIFASLCFTLGHRPYLDRWDNFLANAANAQLYLTLFVGLLLRMGGAGSWMDNLSSLVLMSNLSVVSLFVVLLVAERRVTLKHQRRQLNELYRQETGKIIRRLWRMATRRVIRRLREGTADELRWGKPSPSKPSPSKKPSKKTGKGGQSLHQILNGYDDWEEHVVLHRERAGSVERVQRRSSASRRRSSLMPDRLALTAAAGSSSTLQRQRRESAAVRRRSLMDPRAFRQTRQIEKQAQMVEMRELRGAPASIEADLALKPMARRESNEDASLAREQAKSRDKELVAQMPGANMRQLRAAEAAQRWREGRKNTGRRFGRRESARPLPPAVAAQLQRAAGLDVSGGAARVARRAPASSSAATPIAGAVNPMLPGAVTRQGSSSSTSSSSSSGSVSSRSSSSSSLSGLGLGDGGPPSPSGGSGGKKQKKKRKTMMQRMSIMRSPSRAASKTPVEPAALEMQPTGAGAAAAATAAPAPALAPAGASAADGLRLPGEQMNPMFALRTVREDTMLDGSGGSGGESSPRVVRGVSARGSRRQRRASSRGGSTSSGRASSSGRSSSSGRASSRGGSMSAGGSISEDI